MYSDKHTIGHLLALLTISIWGVTYVSTKILLEEFTPIEILFIRFLIGFIVLSAACLSIYKYSSFKQEIYFAAGGLCGVTLYFLFENIALTYTFASNVGVIVVIAPFFTAILGSIFLKDEKLELKFFIGFAIALIGVVMIIFNGSVELRLNPIGDFLATAASLVWAVYSILTKKISSFGFSTVQATQKTFFYGLVFMLPALYFMDFSPSLNEFRNTVYLFNILFLGLGASALCFATWNYSVKVLGSVKTSAYIYLVPVITVVSSSMILGERITPMAITGTILTLMGLFISENRLNFRGRR